MKTTEIFKQIIKEHLDLFAQDDEEFARKYEKKTLEDCVTYILNQVKSSGRNGFADEEIFGMAVHFFDEEDLKPVDNLKCHIIVNKEIELTPEEIEAERDKARKAVFQEQRMSMLKKKPTTTKTEPKKPDQEVKQNTLF